MHVDGHIAFLEYILKPDKIYLIHTEVPPAIGNRGIGSKLVKRFWKTLTGAALKLYLPVHSLIFTSKGIRNGRSYCKRFSIF
jgi:hypothetical protein